MPMMSMRQYAKHRGCDLKAVQKALAAGRISKAGTKIDSEAADAAWEANTEPMTGHRDYAQSEKQGENGHPKPNGSAQKYIESRAGREELRRQREQLEFDELAGRLVPIEEFESRLSGVISTSRTKVLSLPSKIKSHLPHLTMRDVATIDKLVRETLEELANVGDS
jgi:phage terminase Nu1 subunit (DNA packaging protein)